MTQYTKEKLLNKNKKYNAYKIIKNNFEVSETITLDKIMSLLKNEGIDCNRGEANQIIKNAKKYAWYSDKFSIQNIDSDNILSYKICID